jgi:uncharacterized protein YhhL (DUF1145 family)
MSVITIARTNKELPPESVLEQVRGFLFGVFDGAHRDRKARMASHSGSDGHVAWSG